MKFAWVHGHRGEFEVEVMCRALGVSRSGFHAWKGRPAGRRSRRRQELVGQIRRVHARALGVYGSPRVAAELKESGVSVCENTVAKYMRQERIAAKTHRRFRAPRTTDSDHGQPVADNLLRREFASEAPDTRWCGDITYVPTAEGWLYLAVVLDLCSRKVVGWAMADHLRAQLCLDALAMAVDRRRPGPGLLHHSDRGVQYASAAYRSFQARHGMTASMSRRGDCYDNAAAESFFGTLKRELVHHERYETRDQARSSIFQYIEAFYNRRRRHSAIGYVSPDAFEAAFN